MDKTEAEQLARKITDGTITPSELKRFEHWYNSQPPSELEWVSADNASSLKERIRKGLLQKISEEPVVLTMKSRNKWWRVAAAVTLFVMLGGGLWFYLKPAPDNSPPHLPLSQRYRNDVIPAQGEVLLSMDNGTKLGLDSINNGDVVSAIDGQLVQLPAVIASKTADGLVYLPTNITADIQTITTGKGKDYRLILSDGTKVWLDALSSISFPSAFQGSTREVSVTGQAYFEVAKDPRKPFIVRSGEQQVRVLGTHFNVKNFGSPVTTTLFEGSVELVSANKQLLLAPGEQGKYNGATFSLDKKADLDEALAWKNGRFYFDGNTIESIMEQISRWYDIKINYKEKVQETFVAKVPRNVPLSRLLQLLEMTRQVAFSINGNEVTVMRP